MVKASQENIKVVVRFRPFNLREKNEKGKYKVDYVIDDNSQQIKVRSDNLNSDELKFGYDHVFSQETSQEQFYQIACRPVVEEVLKGYNGSLFAYGQTGSGKTYTMTGVLEKAELQGVIPRVAKDIFEKIRNSEAGTEYKISCQFLEIYNEKIQDLFDRQKQNLKIHESPQKGIFVEGLTEEYVGCEDDIVELAKFGSNNKQVSATHMNSESSRSHTIFIINISATSANGETTTGKLNLIDLAGSEKVEKTEAEGIQLTEAKQINKSLTSLGICMNALVERKKHIPFRDSKLTRVLQESLGGNSKTTMICAVSPSPFNYEETISTLRFGQRAKSIQCAVKINAVKSSAELQQIIEKLEKQINLLVSKNKQLQEQLDLLGQGRSIEQTTVEDDEKEEKEEKEEESEFTPQRFAELQLKLDELQSNYNEETFNLKQEIKDYEKENEDLKKSIKILKEELEKKDDEFEAVKETEESFKKKLELLEREFTFNKEELMIEIKNYKQLLEEEENKRKDLIKELENTKEEAKHNATQLIEIAQSITDTEARAKTISAIESLSDSNKLHRQLNSQLKERIYDLELQIEEEKIKSGELEADIGSIEEESKREITRLEKENKKLFKKVKQLEKERDEIEEDCVDLELESNKFLSEIEVFEEKEKDLKDKIKKLEGELLRRDEDIVSLKLRLKNAELEKKGCTNIDEELEDFLVEEYSNEVKKARAYASSVEEKKDKLIFMLKEELKEEKKNIETFENDYNKRLDRLENQLIEEKDNADELEAELLELEELPNKLKDEIRDLKLELKREISLREDKEASFEKLEEEYKTHIKSKETDLAQMMIQKENLKQQAGQLQQQVEILATKVKDEELRESITKQTLGKNWANELFELKNRLIKTEDMKDRFEKEANYSRQQIQSERHKLQSANKKIELQSNRIVELQKEIDILKTQNTLKQEERKKFKAKKQLLQEEVEKLKLALKAAEESISSQMKMRRRNAVFRPIQSGKDASSLMSMKEVFGQSILKRAGTNNK